MSDIHTPPIEADHIAAELVERRRPGRADNVAPALIPLLRGSDAPTLNDADDATDPVAPARGIVTGLLLSGAVWAAVVGAILFWFG